MYKIYDYYEGRQLVAECEDFESMKKAKKEYIADTDGECDLEDAVKELFWNSELDIYTQSTESDFHTESIDLVEEEDD